MGKFHGCFLEFRGLACCPVGRIAVLGHYDDHYNTGPIPCLDLLKTAMVHPKPQLNLMGMTVSPDRKMVSFGLSRMDRKSRGGCLLRTAHGGGSGPGAFLR